MENNQKTLMFLKNYSNNEILIKNILEEKLNEASKKFEVIHEKIKLINQIKSKNNNIIDKIFLLKNTLNYVEAQYLKSHQILNKEDNLYFNKIYESTNKQKRKQIEELIVKRQTLELELLKKHSNKSDDI
uniref:Flagellar FliJ protein n=1 Tax=Parastrongyloides trichosuri TaxID=131310 RepID=A0A0N4ZEZ4_PARTI